MKSHSRLLHLSFLRNPFRKAATTAAALCLAALLQVPLTAQSPAGKVKPAWPPPGETPRTADGKPDLSGPWEPNAIRLNVDLVATGVQVPLKPWAEKVYHEHKDNISRDDPEARCMPPGVPRMNTTPYPFRLLQTPGLTVIVYEGGAHVWRQIFTDGREHAKDPNPS